MTQPFADLHCEYSWASGRAFADCASIGRRWRDEYGTMLSDSDDASVEVSCPLEFQPRP